MVQSTSTRRPVAVTCAEPAVAVAETGPVNCWPRSIHSHSGTPTNPVPAADTRIEGACRRRSSTARRAATAAGFAATTLGRAGAASRPGSGSWASPRIIPIGRPRPPVILICNGSGAGGSDAVGCVGADGRRAPPFSTGGWGLSCGPPGRPGSAAAIKHCPTVSRTTQATGSACATPTTATEPTSAALIIADRLSMTPPTPEQFDPPTIDPSRHR